MNKFIHYISRVAFAGLLVLLVHTDIAAAQTCEKWIAKVVSLQGIVRAQTKDEKQWSPVEINTTFCTGDRIHVEERSRAAIVLANETIIRLDQHTTITFTEVEKKRTSLIDLIIGAVHFISRVPRTLSVSTPFVNGTVEGTEFLARVYKDHTMFSVYEGKVIASNQEGSLELSSGQSAIAEAGRAPVPHVLVKPRDTVQWALYYPPVIYFTPRDFAGDTASGWQARTGESIGYYWKGDLEKAFSTIQDVDQEIDDSRFFNYRAALLLSVGRVDEAGKDIDHALNLSPGNSLSLALQSIMVMVKGEKEKALVLALNAVEADPGSDTGHIALSYARQAHFDLDGALVHLTEAVNLNPENGLAWARLSEVQLSHGKLDEALEAATRAVELNPDLARTQSVLGFAYLAQIKTLPAQNAFEKAIRLDQADPLPHLGLGLAMIRTGKLKEGRREIEIAASLDPGNSLIRSYLGKAYYEEKRDRLAKDQYGMAEALDPHDPTPFFYNAIRKQSINRPVEALNDMQKAIKLNDNRAVYRSKLLLDEDLAARSASLARIYNDLGFQQLALIEGWKSINTDPGSYSAHRFVADSYSLLPRHEIARVSELLQSQLLQPINITPLQPSLGESDLLIFSGTGPGDISFNEFNPLFNRNRITLQLSGVAGGNHTFGDEVVVSSIMDDFSLSIGQFHYKTDGFRKNNDQDQDIVNVFSQTRLSHKTSIQTEFRYKEIETGDLELNFDPDSFLTTKREDNSSVLVRFGAQHNITASSTIVGSFIYLKGNAGVHIGPGPNIIIEDETSRYIAEIQHIFDRQQFNLISGVGHFDADNDNSITTNLFIPSLPTISTTTMDKIETRHTNLYIYSQINYPENVSLTLGGSGDFLDDPDLHLDQFNPKFGITWNPFSSTTLRAAIFRVLNKNLVSDQTVEPTQIAGFNQFFDDARGAESWRYGLALDQKFSDNLYGGVEYSEREVEWSFISVSAASPPSPPPGPPPAPSPSETVDTESEEDMIRAYLYWTPLAMLSLSGEYQYERVEHEFEFGLQDVKELETNKLLLGINFYHPSGFIARLNPVYVHQEGEFVSSTLIKSTDTDSFWVVDVSLGYRLPRRLGIITIEGKNIFDEEFNFQDTDPRNPRIMPEQLILGKFTLSF